jgi:hypothetical protein
MAKLLSLGWEKIEANKVNKTNLLKDNGCINMPRIKFIKTFIITIMVCTSIAGSFAQAARDICK